MTFARAWRDSGKGTIVFEEAVSLPWPEFDITMSVWCLVRAAPGEKLLTLTHSAAPILGQTYQDLLDNLQDVHNQRLRYMDEAGVDYMVLSLTSPGIQAVSNPATAEALATRANNEVARMIANNTMRFGAFCALSMHNPSQAADELTRCVTELGFHGAMLNDFQQSGHDNSKSRGQ